MSVLFLFGLVYLSRGLGQITTISESIVLNHLMTFFAIFIDFLLINFRPIIMIFSSLFRLLLKRKQKQTMCSNLQLEVTNSDQTQMFKF